MFRHRQCVTLLSHALERSHQRIRSTDQYEEGKRHALVELYRSACENIVEGLRSSNADTVHGAILVTGELFKPSREVGHKNGLDYMLSTITVNLPPQLLNVHFKDICTQVIAQKDNRDPIVRKAVMLVLPTLAAFNANEFYTRHLGEMISYLLSQLKKDKDRATAFFAIGKLSVAVGSSIGGNLDGIVAEIRDSLSVKG